MPVLQFPNAAARKDIRTLQKQQTIRNLADLVTKLPADQTPVALVAVGVMPDGTTQSVVLNIDPEHIKPLMEAGETVAKMLTG